MQRVHSVGHITVILHACGSRGSGSGTSKLWCMRNTAGAQARRQRAHERGSTPRPSPQSV